MKLELIKELKVAFIEPVGGHGGNDLYCINCCNALVNQNIKVTFITCNETVIDQKIRLGFPIKKYYKDIYKGKNNVKKGFRFMRGTWKALVYIIRKKVSIVHLHAFGASSTLLFSLIVFKVFRKKTIVTIHDIERFDKGSNDNRFQRLFPLIDFIIVHTYFAKNILEQYITKSDVNVPVRVVPNSDLDTVYQDKITRVQARNYLGLNIGFRYILFFGQIKEVKGLDLLLKAFVKLKEESPDVRLLIAGKFWKTDPEKYFEIIEKNNLQDYVDFRPSYVKNEDVPKYFYASDLVVLPYRKIYNSGVMLRCLDYGSAALCSDLPPFMEVIIDGYNGFIFKEGSIDQLTSKMNGVLNREDIDIIRGNALRTVREKYSLEVIGKKMLECYTEVLL